MLALRLCAAVARYHQLRTCRVFAAPAQWTPDHTERDHIRPILIGDWCAVPASELAVALAGAGEVFDASTMQFDFFKRLLGGFGRPHPREAAPVKLAPQVAAEPADPLLVEARALLRTAGAPALAERVRVEWNARMRSTAGLAFSGRVLVRLNPRLREFGDAEIQRTLRHELAHLLAHERAGRRRIAPHGAEWRRACRDLGLPDEKRTHDLPLPRRVIARRHHYRCPACGVTVARVQPLRRGSACLSCCRAHSRGRYDARFRFERIEPPRAV